MRIAELSRRSGVAMPTIKFYVREGLLPPGERISANQVSYAEEHLHRLRLVRALIEVGGLSIAATKETMREIESPGRSIQGILGTVHRSVAPGPAHLPNELLGSALQEVDELIERRGWQLTMDTPARRSAAEAIATMRNLGLDDFAGLLDVYAQAVEDIAAAELDLSVERAKRGVQVLAEKSAIGIVVGAALMVALRGLAQENASARRFPSPNASAQDSSSDTAS